MPVTSQFRLNPALGEVWLRDWQVAGLLKPSVVKPVLATIEQGLIIKPLGKLGVADLASLKGAIARILVII